MKSFIYSFLLITFLVSICHCEKNETIPTTTLKPSTNTTTEKPSTTTEKPTTPKTTTTTEAPEPPSPKLPPKINGSITDNNYTCMSFNFSIALKLAYKIGNETVNDEFWLPSDTKFLSNGCKNEKQEILYLMFGKNYSSELALTFTKNEASVYLSSITGNITIKNGKSITLNITDPNPNFTVDQSHSYFCANNVTIKNDDQTEIIFSNVQLQAFMDAKQNGRFSSEHNCQNEINDVVPIAVGVALTALVIIVMIAYFIGRRRSRRLAYQSV